jgi:5-formyltetrahydrofolate cyclo-ligase
MQHGTLSESLPDDRTELRRLIRARRRQVSEHDKRAAALSFARAAGRALLLRAGSRIAVYHAYGHEADLSLLIELARSRGCELFLPRITHHRLSRMQFLRYDANAPLQRNSLGILEPSSFTGAPARLRELDLIFMPLVAFDDQGWRLGSGGGFYDRRLHHLQVDRRWRRPKLIGVGYELQRVPRLTPQRWDIPMDAVLTERGLQRISTHRRGFDA